MRRDLVVGGLSSSARASRNPERSVLRQRKHGRVMMRRILRAGLQPVGFTVGVIGAACVLIACQAAVRRPDGPRVKPTEPAMDYDAVVYLLAAKKAERAGDRVEAVIMWEAAVRADEASPSLRLGLARGLLAVNQDSAALESARASLRVDSTFSEGHVFLAEYYRQRGDLSRSAEHLEAAFRRTCDHEMGWKLIHLYNSMGRREESGRVLERLAMNPGSKPSDVLQWARIAESMGMNTAAEMLYRTYVGRWPEGEEGIVAYGGFLDKLSRTSEAEIVYRQGLQARPQSDAIRQKLAWSLLGQERWHDADSITAQTHVSAPEGLDGRKAWISLLLQRGQFALAITHAELLLSSFPDDSDLLVLLGQAHAALGEYRQAAVAFGQAASRDSSTQALTGLVYSQMQAEQYGEAERAARGAMRTFPGDMRLKFMYGAALRAQEKWPQAVEVFGELVRLDPTNAEYLFDWASSLERMGRFDQAVGAFRSLLEREPQNALALNYLGYMFAERGVHLEEALHLITQAVAQEPQNPAYLDSMGWVLYRLGRHLEAKRFLLEAIQYDLTNATMYDHLGEVCRALGERREARAYWEQALSLEPANAALRAKLDTLSRESHSSP